MKGLTLRKAGGIASLPATILALLVIGVIGVFAFEIARLTSVRAQLSTAAEAAALAGAAVMAATEAGQAPDSHTQAMDAASSVFQQNDIFGTILQASTGGNTTPPAGQTLLEFHFLDPANNNLEVSQTDPRGRTLVVKATYGHTPLFGNYLGLGNMPVAVEARGGMGPVDLVLCFDCSAFMDYSTLTTSVRRSWDAVAGRIQYDILAEGPHLLGSIPPQRLIVNPELRGATNTGSPPGNFPPGTASPFGVTDKVVNLDEMVHFAGLSADGYDFPSVAALVEAARGNLENSAVFTSSQASTALSGTVTPRAGYQAKYFELARKHVHPLVEA